jgi:RNA polymerase sigma-70 factor (ECF subfamily)
MHVVPDASSELRDAFAPHRAGMLRHAYQMTGSFPDAERILEETWLETSRAVDPPDARLAHRLMRAVTRRCLKALAGRGVRSLPQLEGSQYVPGTRLEQLDVASWVTPAPDRSIFGSPDQAATARETVSLRFVAFLQRFPPKQRAVVLLADVVGWLPEEVADALEMPLHAVESALQRARETLASRPTVSATEPSPRVLAAYVKAWEAHDLDALVGALRSDVVLAMPPMAAWVEGVRAVRLFFRLPRFEAFWSKGVLGAPTQANAQPAVAWYAPDGEGVFRPYSLEVIRFEGPRIAETTHFIGASYLAGFGLPDEREVGRSE